MQRDDSSQHFLLLLDHQPENCHRLIAARSHKKFAAVLYDSN